MALLARLFSPRRNQKKDTSVVNSVQNNGPNRFTTFSVERDQVRVMLFRECDWRGRKLLFDSASVQKVTIDSQTPVPRPRSDSKELIVEVANGVGYQYKRPNPDITALGETIFGSVAMASKGSTLKVHTLKEPYRIMLTKVVQAPRSGHRKRNISDRSLDDSCGSSINSLSDTYNSSSIDSKLGSVENNIQRTAVPQDDSGFTSDWQKQSSSTSCDYLPYCPLHYSGLSPNMLSSSSDNNSSSFLQNNQSGGSLSSLRRRWNRSIATSMDLDSGKCILSSSQSENITSNPDLNHPTAFGAKRTKLGLALIIPLQDSHQQEMEEFMLEHLPLLNNILTRLQYFMEQAYTRKDVFVQSMLHASHHASQSVYDIVCGARLCRPLWLTLTSHNTSTSVCTELANKLVQDIAHLLQNVDTKQTNFFVSTLLTAVLTHHLGWVPTVLNDLPSHIYTDTLLSDLSKAHPYNPLWAQMSDLRGAIGHPVKVARTIVVGRSEVLVNKMLSMLSYFIRCGQVSVVHQERQQLDNEEEMIDSLIETNSGNPTVASFSVDDIQDLNKIYSEKSVSSCSTSTLCRSKTVLSMKTFTCNDSDCSRELVSSESGFNSNSEFTVCDGNKQLLNSRDNVNKCTETCGLKKNKSCFILGSSLANNINVNFNSEDLFDGSSDRNTMPKLKKLSHVKSLNSFEDQPLISVVSDASCMPLLPQKTESQMQLSSIELKNLFNKGINGNLFSGESDFLTSGKLVQSDINKDEEKEEKVVFVLGENEELVDIKGKDKNVDCVVQEPPAVLVEDCHEDNLDNFTCLDCEEERCRTEGIISFVAGDVDSKVVIVKPTMLQTSNSKRSLHIKQEPLHRCLSVPEQVVLATDDVKKKRIKEACEIARRWFSDSAIITKTYKHLDSENKYSDSNINKMPIISVDNNKIDFVSYRTSSRSLKETRKNNNKCDNLVIDKHQTSSETLCSESNKSRVCDFKTSQKNMHQEESVIELPLPESAAEDRTENLHIADSLIGGISDHYIPEMILQGISHVQPGWENDLKRDLVLEAHSPDAETELTESVCILANMDTWEVQLISSHSMVVERNTGGYGIRAGMSQLVANILETTLQLCKLSVPPHVCLEHIESKLAELCVRSQALAELLLSTEFLDMATLTSTLSLDPNDVPLLLSAASTHTPQVTKKYGLTFQ